MYAINYDGLRKRDTYNELIDYIQFGQEKITYPDRFAKRIRESPQISNLLDGEGLGKGDMEEQQLNHMKEILKEFSVREAGGTAQVSRASRDPPFIRGSPTPSDYDPQVQDLADMLQNITLENDVNQQRQANDTRQQNQNRLNNVNDQNNRFLLGGHRMLPNNPVASLPRPPPAKSSSSLQPMEYDIGTPRMAKAKSEPKPKSLNLLRSNIPKATQPNFVENAFGGEPESEARLANTSTMARSVAKAVPKTPSTAPATPPDERAITQTVHNMSMNALRQQLLYRGQSDVGGRHTLEQRLIRVMLQNVDTFRTERGLRNSRAPSAPPPRRQRQ